jgi:hypothetical protein
VPCTLDLRYILTNQARGLVLSVLMEELGELAVGGEGGLDGDDDVGGQVGNARDCEGESVCLDAYAMRLCALFLPPLHSIAGHMLAAADSPASPAVRMEAILASHSSTLQSLEGLETENQLLLQHRHDPPITKSEVEHSYFLTGPRNWPCRCQGK